MLYFVSFAVILVGLAIYSTTPTSGENSSETENSQAIQEQDINHITSPELTEIQTKSATSPDDTVKDLDKT